MIIDVSRALFRNFKGRIPTGIDVVLIKYLEFYKDDVDLYISKSIFSFVIPNKYSKSIIKSLCNNKNINLADFFYSLFLSIGHNLRSRKVEYFFNIGHSNLEKSSYFKKVFKYSNKLVVILYDLIPLSNPEFCTEKQSKIHHLRLLNIARYANNVFAISEFVQREFNSWCKENKIKPPRNTVNYLGSKFEDCVNNFRANNSSDYFLAVGTIEPRKNYSSILNFWMSKVKNDDSFKSKLIIVGQLGWMYERELRLIRDDVLSNHVVHKENCSDKELLDLYINCKALIIPSYVEGFGLPALDAAVLKVPVIASDIEVFREYLNNYPLYFDPKSTSCLAEVMSKFKNQKYELPNLPCWSAHFDKLNETLDNV